MPLQSVVQEVGEVLRAGGAVVLATDTVYGLAVLPTDPRAVARVWALKDRPPDQPLAVLVADVAQAQALTAVDLSALGAGSPRGPWLAWAWPGSLTLVVPRSAAAADLHLGGDPDTIGIRCPADVLVRAVAAEVGPLAATSANRHGEPTPTTADDASTSLAGDPDLVVDGGPAGTVASTVVDLTGPVPRVLRAGALDPVELGLDRPG